MKKVWVLLLFLLALDVGSKIFALHSVPLFSPEGYPFGGIGIFELGPISFSLNKTFNTGAAWGMFTNHPAILFFIRSIIIACLILFVPKRLPLWLVVIGAMGNAIDYCLYGHVIDFFHFCFWGYSFPIFNVADSCISIGVILMLFASSSSKEVKVS